MKRVCLFLLAASASLLALENPNRRPDAPAVSVPTADLPAAALPPDPRPFTNAPEGAGVTIEGTDQEVRTYTSMTVTFPTDMVTPDKIDAEGVESPVEFWPPLNAEFYWTTPTQGTLSIVGNILPDQTYKLRLREGLTDLAGTPLDVNAWGAEMKSPAFAIVEENYGERESLNARPQVPLEFNYPVRLADAAKGAWFQNRVTRERFPAEILLNTAEGETDPAVVDGRPGPDDVFYAIRVRPLNPLPVGAFYDLVVEGIVDARAGRGLPYPRVFPLGPTRPLTVDYVAARNAPLEKPNISIKFRQMLSDDPLPPGAVTVTPTVPNLTVLQDPMYLTLEGDFVIGTRYTVKLSEKITGAAGFPLAKAETWGATFKPRGATILFPDRIVRERSALGLRFAFYQVNTGELEWKLAPVPLDKLPEVTNRLQEFQRELEDENGNAVWTADGLLARASTDLLIPTFGLNPIGSGTVAASPGETETLREISWRPTDGELAGPMLLEITGKDDRGRTIGNRALVFFGDQAVTRKVAPSETILRVAALSDAQPTAGAVVAALDGKLQPLAQTTTDAQGLATFAQAAIPGAEYFTATVNGRVTLQPSAMADSFSSGYTSAHQPPPLRSVIFTDRPLYRPGQEVSFKGIVREAAGGKLTIPAGRALKWTIASGYGNEVYASGEAKIDADGSWHGAWTPPAEGPLGEMQVRAAFDKVALPQGARFRIEEFRNPPFSVVCEATDQAKPGEAIVAVESQYFHGAPNAGARVVWTATWTSDSEGTYYDGGDDPFTRVDLYSENRHEPAWMVETSGEAALDANGQAVLRCNAPFKDPGNRAHSRVVWKVEVTGPDGQTITGGAEDRVAMLPVLLGVRHDETEKRDELVFAWNAEAPFGEEPSAVRAELFQVLTKSVKERLAPNVYRYRNFDQFVSVEKRDRVTEETLTFRPKDPGRYVLVVSPLAGAAGMPVSEEAFLAGDEPSDVPVTSDTTAQVFSVTNPENRPWKVGETAALTVLSSTPGVAWVSVETDRILDTFTVPLAGNTSRIEIPIKPEYEPNVFVAVYLLRPGGDDRLAGEMFGSTTLRVAADTRALDVAVTVDQAQVEPREKVSGQVRVTAAGQPVANADLAIYAVDDSVLELGGWQLPAFLDDFFPTRSWAVVTFSALRAYVDKILPNELTMKGFVIGDGGDEPFSNVTFARKEFKPIILWKPNVKTDAQGVAKFSCDAPDNLTRFRVIAVGQTKASQFGAGSATFEVTKNLLVEPALPRFVREGDEVELRAVVRQKVTDSAPILVRCTAGGSLTLTDGAEQTVTAAKDAPVVVRFRAKAGAVGSASVKFEVVAKDQPKLADAVEISLPVAEPVILRREAVSGRVGKTTFRAAEVAPGEWENARGTFTFALSTTPWLGKLLGLPYLLDYPHGCFEQKTSRLLACTYLGGLLDYLPEEGDRRKNYATVIEDTLTEIEASLLPGGLVPYWPQGTTANDYVTIQTAWCVAQAEAAGFEIPARLADELPGALEKIITRQNRENTSETLRAFALFVASLIVEEPSDEVLAAANDLYLRRDQLSGEGRAMLAIAYHRMKTEPEKQRQLLRELPVKFDDIRFQPTTFASATRTEALCTWARLVIDPGQDATRLRERLDALLESSASLSTQENLWLLVAFDALLKATPAVPIRPGALSPVPQDVAANKTAVAWTKQDLAKLADFVVKGFPNPKATGSYVLAAAYRGSERLTPLESRGLRVERVVKNLSDPARLGTAEAPFRLGDQLLISYRFTADEAQSFVAVEDMLPAGIEVVNPNLALFAATYSLPDEPNVTTLGVSHSEMRDQQTNLYFDHLPAGSAAYAVLARVTAAGRFIWPATQMQPMYDSRFFGRSPSGECFVRAE